LKFQEQTTILFNNIFDS